MSEQPVNIIFEADELGSYSKSIMQLQMAIGHELLPSMRRMVEVLLNTDRWLRGREALRRAVILAVVWFILLALLV